MDTGPAFTTRIEVRKGVASIALRGELDMATAPTLADELAAAERDGASIAVIDIRELVFIDSSGLHALVAAHKRSEEGGKRLLIVGANPFLRRLCEVTKTQFLLDGEGAAAVRGRDTVVDA